MDKIDINVTGAVEIKAAMDNVAEGLTGDEVQEACMQAGFMFEEKAKWYASGMGGGPQVRTGNLRASIQTEPTKEGGAEVSPHTDYAMNVEFGTSHSRPYPYMRPAYEVTLSEATKFLSDRVGDGVEIRFAE